MKIKLESTCYVQGIEQEQKIDSIFNELRYLSLNRQENFRLVQNDRGFQRQNKYYLKQEVFVSFLLLGGQTNTPNVNEIPPIR